MLFKQVITTEVERNVVEKHGRVAGRKIKLKQRRQSWPDNTGLHRLILISSL